MTAAFFLPLLAAALTGARAELPQLTYRYSTFVVAAPELAASFFRNTTGAVALARSEFEIGDTGKADVAGCRLLYADGLAHLDVYFLSNDPSLPGAHGKLDPNRFASTISESLSMAQDDWNWWMDWHLCYFTDDLDAMAVHLWKLDVDFVNRGSGSLYFAIPHTGILIQVLGESSPSVFWTEAFLFCRPTDELTAQMQPSRQNVTNIDALVDQGPPVLTPAHASLVAADARTSATWAYTFLNVSAVDTDTGAGGSHAFADGTCAEIQWMEVSPDGWQLHLIEQFVKRQGPLQVARFQQYVSELHGDMSQPDAYHNYRLAFSVDSVQPYEANLEAHQEPYYKDARDARRIRVALPTGYVLELFEDATSAFDVDAAHLAMAGQVNERR